MQGKVGNAPPLYLHRTALVCPGLFSNFNGLSSLLTLGGGRGVGWDSLLLSPSHQLTRRIYSVFKGQRRSVRIRVPLGHVSAT